MKKLTLPLLIGAISLSAAAQTTVPDFKSMTVQPTITTPTSWGSCDDFVYVTSEKAGPGAGFSTLTIEYYDGVSWKNLPSLTYKGSGKRLHYYNNTIYLNGSFSEFNSITPTTGNTFFLLQLKGSSWDTVMNSDIPTALTSLQVQTVQSGFYLLQLIDPATGKLHRFLPATGITSTRTVVLDSAHKGLKHLYMSGNKNTLLLDGNITKFGDSVISSFVVLVNDVLSRRTFAGAGYPVRANVDFNGDIYYHREYGTSNPYKHSNGTNTSLKYNIMYTMLGYLLPRNGELIFGPGKQLGGASYDFYLGKNGNYWYTAMVNKGSYGIMVNDKLGYFSLDIASNTWRHLEYLPAGTIRGKFYADLDANCVYNSSKDTLLRNAVVTVKGTNSEYSVVTDNDGDYSIIVPLDSFTLSQPNPDFSLNSCSKKFVITDTSSIDTADICVFPKYSDDLECKIIAGHVTRLDATAHYQIRVKNKGLATRNALLTLTYDKKQVYISSSQSPASNTTGKLTWNIQNLKPLSQRTITCDLEVAFDSFQLGDTLLLYATLDTMTGEDDTLNNRDSLKQRIVYSYDPNSKTSDHDGTATVGIKKLRYYIQFQNEGTDYAQDVVVRDSLPGQVSIEEIDFLGSSHPCKMNLVNGIITFTFSNIHLLPKSQNEPMSQGWLSFDVGVEKGLGAGTTIKNNASIYFDRNDPVVTEYSTVLLVNPNASVTPVRKGSDLQIYPNPASNTLTIVNPLKESLKVQMFDLTGNLLGEQMLEANGNASMDISRLPGGIYLLRSSVGSQKFMKLN